MTSATLHRLFQKNSKPLKLCPNCEDEGMDLIDSTEVINEWNNEIEKWEQVDTSRFMSYRCNNCDYEEVI